MRRTRTSRHFVAKAKPAQDVALASWVRYGGVDVLEKVCEACEQEQAEFEYVWYEEEVKGESLTQRFERTLAEQRVHGPVAHEHHYYCVLCAFALMHTFGNDAATLHFLYATEKVGRGVGGAFYRIASRPEGAVFCVTPPGATLQSVYKRRFEAALHGPMKAKIGVQHDG